MTALRGAIDRRAQHGRGLRLESAQQCRSPQLQTRAADESLEPEARSLAELAALEAELELDALTAGWFSSRLARRAGAE